MKYVLIGDTKERKDRQDTLIDSFQASVHHVYQGDLKSTSFESLVPQEDDLFGEARVYVLHNLVRDLSLKKILEKYKKNSHVLIFLEDSLLKKDTQVFEEYLCIPEVFKKGVVPKKGNKIFDLAAAFAQRDKKNTWLLFHELMGTSAPEEIHGVLLWQLKNILLVHDSGVDSGLSPYVFKKTQGYIQKISKEECIQAINELTSMFHNRDKFSTLIIELESFILSFL